MVETLEAIVGIAAYMTVLMLMFVGLGLGIQRLFRVPPIDLDRCLTAFWIGFAVHIGFLNTWHLFYAITGYVILLVGFTGLVGLWANRAPLLAWVSTLTRSDVTLAVICLVTAMVCVSSRAAGPPVAFDSGMYHVPAVTWYTTYPAVLGLGNLHDRLALNSSSLLYDAMLGAGPWAGRSTHVANGLLVLVFLFQVLLSAKRFFGGKCDHLAACVFNLVLLAPLIAILISHDISSFTTDIPPAIVFFVLCSTVYRAVSTNGKVLDAYDLAGIAALAALAICLKLSFVVAGPLLVIVALGSTLLKRPSSVITARSIKWSLGVAAFLIVPWIAHGILLSGYPLYPSTFGGAPVEWRVPAELANATRAWVVVTSRKSISSGLSWLPEWIRTQMKWSPARQYPQLSEGMFGIIVPTLMAGTFLAGAVAVRRVKILPQGWAVVSACGISAVFWFVSAPSPRFGFAVLWSLAAASVAFFSEFNYGVVRRFALPAVLMLAATPVLFPIPRRNVVETFLKRVMTGPGPDHGLHPYPRVETYRFTTVSGLVLNVPVNDNQCFDSPIPCTPHPAPNLIITQGKGRLEFLTNGRWQQLNWPNATTDFLKSAFLEKLRASEVGK